jgi:hypothetical protein
MAQKNERAQLEMKIMKYELLAQQTWTFDQGSQGEANLDG